jgi:hypothetical protein
MENKLLAHDILKMVVLNLRFSTLIVNIISFFSWAMPNHSFDVSPCKYT